MVRLRVQGKRLPLVLLGYENPSIWNKLGDAYRYVRGVMR